MKETNMTVCPVEITLELIGNKWVVLILRELFSGTKRFSELFRGIPGISQKMLTQQLKAMESKGMVKREVFAEVPPRVEYSLTETGSSVKPVIDSMAEWGKRYFESNSQKMCK